MRNSKILEVRRKAEIYPQTYPILRPIQMVKIFFQRSFSRCHSTFQVKLPLSINSKK
ncbi:unnamed protein product [Spirodela intermedia]|uniref:Uncharacterized protein n=1 Tax=Spirodela intermedia TaxID=51605 RepID=A0A7I8JQN0_SPIIN|nr:unnamed protein product [Spirodela intermedia]CAA6671893.1 unnamed protein product [Spirodela intermedia]